MYRLTFLLPLFISFNLFAQRDVLLIIADDIGTDYFGFYADHINIGQLVYYESAIDKQDFSSISKGIYYLKWNESHTIKILKD